GSRLLSLLLLVSPFLFFAISVVYSTESIDGYKKIFQILPLFLIPFIFFISHISLSIKEISRILTLFSVSVFIIVAYQILESLLNMDYLTKSVNDVELIRNGFNINEVI